MKTWLSLILAAFIVQLTDGTQVLVREAVGFVLTEVTAIPCIGFFDKNMKSLVAFPTETVRGAMYVPDDRVM
jgi:uncharacterized sodium:solute symporter family permease YidK